MSRLPDIAAAPQAAQVYLVGAGPGSADLLTLRGWRLLQHADVVVCDDLVDPAALDGLRAEIVYVGKRGGQPHTPQQDIEALLIARAKAGQLVVRLKGGDPFVLGRGSEELLALTAAGLRCEVVPGVSSATAAPLLAGIPVTHRGIADAFCVVSAHPRPVMPPSFPPYHARQTLVVLMGVATLPAWLPALQPLGYRADLPVAVVTWAGRPQQQVLVTDLGHVQEAAASGHVHAPAVIVIGHVVSLRSATANRLPAW